MSDTKEAEALLAADFVSPTGDAFCRYCGEWNDLSLDGRVLKPADTPLRYRYRCGRCKHTGYVGRSKENGAFGVWS